MKIKKILIVPSVRIVIPELSGIKQLRNIVKKFIKKEDMLYDGEVQFYSDISKVLGKENTIMLGSYRPYFYLNPPPFSSHPSNHGVSQVTSIKISELKEALKQVDVLLLSVNSLNVSLVIECAREEGVSIAMIDFHDHEELYGASRKKQEKEVFRGFTHGKDFDLYFKKDFEQGLKTKTLLPLAPITVRPESYSFHDVSKKYSIFYSGRPRPDRCQGDRIETVNMVKKYFNDALILEHDTEKTFMSLAQYCENLSLCKIALSPSGRSWDSFRNTEVALASNTALLAPKPYIETTGPELKDGINAILYDVKIAGDGKYHLSDENKLLEKLRYYLSHDEEREKIAWKWKEDVLKGHTILARSQYILDSIEKTLG